CILSSFFSYSALRALHSFPTRRSSDLSGDVNGDGFNDVITGAGNGGGARVRVYDGHNVDHGRPVKLYDFLAFGSGYRGGVYVAADRKSTRLNSSHQIISYAVFCLKKKK